MDAAKLTALIGLIGAIGGFIGGAIGWMARTLSSLNKRETDLWENMQKRLAEYQEQEEECRHEVAALNQGILLVTQENGVLKQENARLHAEVKHLENEFKLAIEGKR